MATYVDGIRVRIEGYEEGYPSPENLSEGLATFQEVGEEIDRDRLLDELHQVLRRNSAVYHLTERYGETSWGAYGASLDLVIQIGLGVGTSIAGTVIWEAIKKALPPSRFEVTMDSEGVVHLVPVATRKSPPVARKKSPPS